MSRLSAANRAKLFHYEGKCLRVIDSDTVDLELDLGLSIRVTERVRLYGVNAPESYGPQASEAGAAAKIFTALWFEGTPPLLVQGNQFKPREKYGRLLATIYREGDPEPLNDALLRTGHAVAYLI